MVTLHSFEELKQLAPVLGPEHTVQEGDIYLLGDELTRFSEVKSRKHRPYVVVAVKGQNATVCPRTTRINHSRPNVILHHADPLAGLEKDGVILTRQSLRRRVALEELTPGRYLGTIGRDQARLLVK